MPPSHFPLRWESTGDQWWYATPIDFAAANGHYDLVRELLYLDTNLLIKLTSLRRIRRLETVWDDEEQFNDVAKCRSHVARLLLLECETKRGHNTLIRAGYGGWLLYTAASAGDGTFVKELLERDPLLVFAQTDRSLAYTIWNPGSEFALCDCPWSRQGNLCKHVIKVAILCKNRQVARPLLASQVYRQALLTLLQNPPDDPLVLEHVILRVSRLQQDIKGLEDLSNNGLLQPSPPEMNSQLEGFSIWPRF